MVFLARIARVAAADEPRAKHRFRVKVVHGAGAPCR